MTVARGVVFDPLLKTEPCRFILDHWQTLRGDRLLPRRAQIEPAALARYLPHVGLFEVQARHVTLCRLAGTALRLSLGFELTGKNVVDLYSPELQRAVGYRFFMMATQPCAASLEMPLRFSTGAENPYEVVLLPLEPDDPAAAPTLLVGTSAIDAVTWQNARALPKLHASPTFRFVDIGAGIPASTLPPDDF